MPSALRLEALAYAFPGSALAVNSVSLEIAPGELFCLLGPSGCGKSTLLRLIGGYLPPLRGRVWIQEREVTSLPPEKRDTGMVFQSYALFPHLSALDNVAFGLRVRGMAKVPRHAKAHEMLDWVGLTLPERSRRPAELSGGQQQRVALARALAFGPKLLMLDEPFANLDRLLRERLREEVREVQRRAGVATILVTHDREEALSMGDRIGIMSGGRLLQVGTPEEVYNRPAQLEVARFLGHQNLLTIESRNGEIVTAGGVRAHVLPSETAGERDFLLVRPELVRISGVPFEASIPALVKKTRFAGAQRTLVVEIHGGGRIELAAPAQDATFCVGMEIFLEVPRAALRIVRGDGAGASERPFA